MKFNNVNIIGTGVYTPEKLVPYEESIAHFKSLGLEEDAKNIFKLLDKRDKYVAEGLENALTMAVDASRSALTSAAVAPEDIDMIVYVSDTPEYTLPVNAVNIASKLGASNAKVVYDMNANCTGIVTALDQVCSYAKSKNNIRKILVASGINMLRWANETDPIFYGTWGDLGAAVVLECVEEDKPRGYIDSVYKMDYCLVDKAFLPYCGFSKIHDSDVKDSLKKVNFIPFDFITLLAPSWSELTREITFKNNITPFDINHFIISQFSKYGIEETLKALEIQDYKDKYTYVGDKFGYTGVTSPILALHNAIQSNKVKTGDKIIMTSIGSGYTISMILFEL